MSFKTNLTMIKMLLDDIRSGAKYNANDTKILRYLVSNIYNVALHEKMSIQKDIDSPDYVYMSEKFKKSWEEAGKPSGAPALRKIGVHEHMIPLNVLIKRMIIECTDEESVYKFIRENNKLVFVTKEEDGQLTAAGYQRSLPKDGEDRYASVGIIVYPEPVRYKNYGKYI